MSVTTRPGLGDAGSAGRGMIVGATAWLCLPPPRASRSPRSSYPRAFARLSSARARPATVLPFCVDRRAGARLPAAAHSGAASAGGECVIRVCVAGVTGWTGRAGSPLRLRRRATWKYVALRGRARIAARFSSVAEALAAVSADRARRLHACRRRAREQFRRRGAAAMIVVVGSSGLRLTRRLYRGDRGARARASVAWA